MISVFIVNKVIWVHFVVKRDGLLFFFAKIAKIPQKIVRNIKDSCIYVFFLVILHVYYD